MEGVTQERLAFNRGVEKLRNARIFRGTRPWPACIKFTGTAADSNSRRTRTRAPLRTLLTTWNDKTRVIPNPAMVAATADSALATSRERTVTDTLVLPVSKIQTSGEANPPNVLVMQSCWMRSRGARGFPRSEK